MPQYLKPESIDECDRFLSEYEARIEEYITKCNSLDDATDITVADLPVLVLNSRTRPVHRLQLERCESLQDKIDYAHIVYEYAIRGLEAELVIVNGIKDEIASQAA